MIPSFTLRATFSSSVFVCTFLLLTHPVSAISITHVQVTIGSTDYTPASVGWSFPVTLQPGQDLVLTQHYQGPPDTSRSYNFDTSDGTQLDTSTGIPEIPLITFTVDGVTTSFLDTLQILTVGGHDGGGNEAQDWRRVFTGLGVDVYLGYADTVHPERCGALAESVGLRPALTCLPSPFFEATVFQGTGAYLQPGNPQSQPFHCGYDDPDPTCRDSAGIRFIALPEPSNPVPESGSLVMLGTGLLVGAWTMKHERVFARRRTTGHTLHSRTALARGVRR